MSRARRLLLVAGALIVAAGCVAGFRAFSAVHAGEPEFALDRFDPYLRRTSGELADPVNIVFEGANATTTADAIHRVLGWPKAQGSEMVFQDQGTTRPTAWQFALPLANNARLHLRIEAASGSGNEAYVLVGAHRDDTVACGHVGHNFNSTRNTIAGAFKNQGFKVTMMKLDNVQPGRQCDGSMTSGDGSVAVIDLRSGRLPDLTLIPAGNGFLPPLSLNLPR